MGAPGRVPFDDLPETVRMLLTSLQVDLVRTMPNISGIQLTIDGLGAETPPTVDVRYVTFMEQR